MTLRAARALTLVNRRGLHARASASLARLAGGLPEVVMVSKGGEAVRATSIMGLMMLGAACGDSVTVTAEGPEAEDAVQKVAGLIENRFGESE